MQIATKPGIGAPRHFCQTIISPVVWALNKQPFPPSRVLPFPIPSRLFLYPPTLALLSQYFFFFPLRAWHNVQQSSLRSPADKLWVSFGLCWTRGNSCGRLLAHCPGNAAGMGKCEPGCSVCCQCFRLPWGLEKLVIRAPCSRLLSFTLICLKQL